MDSLAKALSKEKKQNEKENNILKKITYGKNLKVCFVTTYIMSMSNSAMYLEEKDEFIEEELFDEDTEYLSEDKGESNRLSTFEAKMGSFNTSVQRDMDLLKQEVSSLKSSFKEEKVKNKLLRQRTNYLEEFTAKPFILNICTQILIQIAMREGFRNSKSTYFKDLPKEQLEPVEPFLNQFELSLNEFRKLADDCITIRNKTSHPSSAEELRKQARLAKKLLVKSEALEMKFEYCVLGLICDEKLWKVYFQ